MKKYIPLIAMLGALFTSCSNDDIDIIESADLSLNISTQSVYDDFGIADDFKQTFIGGKGYSIGVYSYIYDENGKLAASDSTYVNTFGKVTQNFNNLKSGNYTSVTVEMLVENDNDYSSPNWVIAGQENIETLQILNTDWISFWYTAVGVKTESFFLPKGGVSKEINPEGIGAIVFNTITNFNNSDYACVNLFTKDMPNGRYLSPNYKGEERFIYDSYNESNIWNTRAYSYKSAGLSASVYPAAYFLEEGVVRYCFGAQEIVNGELETTFYCFPNTNSYFNVKDGGSYYGGFHYIGGTPGNDCVAGMFDTFSSYWSWYNQIISSYSTEYTKPYLQWGASASAVDSYMKNNNITLSDSGSDSSSDLYWSYYINSSATVGYEYHFDYSRNNLSTVFVNFDSDYYTIAALRTDLGESYTGGEYSSDLNGYIYMSDQTVLLLSNDTSDGFITVLYIPNSTASVPYNKLRDNKSLKKVPVKAINTNKTSSELNAVSLKSNK